MKWRKLCGILDNCHNTSHYSSQPHPCCFLFQKMNVGPNINETNSTRSPTWRLHTHTHMHFLSTLNYVYFQGRLMKRPITQRSLLPTSPSSFSAGGAGWLSAWQNSLSASWCVHKFPGPPSTPAKRWRGGGSRKIHTAYSQWRRMGEMRRVSHRTHFLNEWQLPELS